MGARASRCQAESDDCIAAAARSPFDCFQDLIFQAIGIGNQFAGGNVSLGGALVAEFANPQATFRAHRRTEYPARDGAAFVELTKSRLRIKHRTGLVIGEVLKASASFFTFAQYPGSRISGKIFSETIHRIASAFSNGRRAFRSSGFQFRQPTP